MTVKELREELAKCPDDAEVMVMDMIGNDMPPTIAYNDETNTFHIF